MHAVILAGGFGKWLRPITHYVPKPLIPIHNIPILEWQIRYLKKFNIQNITVCTGYKTEQIENFLKAKSDFGIKIQVSQEKVPLGTGGAIKKVGRHIDGESFLVINGDILSDINLKIMLGIQNAIAGIELQTQFGTLDVLEDKITRFREKKSIRNIWMNAGIYHLSCDVIGKLPVRGDIEKTVFPKMAKQKKLHIVKFTDVKWFSIDSHKDIEECSKVVSSMIKYD